MKTLLAGLSVLISVAALAQQPAFEAASIRRNDSGREGGGAGPRGDRFLANNLPLTSLLAYAFQPPQGQLLRSQIVGAPAWADSDRYDIEAKAAGDGRPIPIAQIRAMVQSLLQDRFQLKWHSEKRDLPVYHLVLLKGGPKLSQDQTPPETRNLMIDFITAGAPETPLPRGAMRMVRGPSSTTLIGSAVSVSRLMLLLRGQSDRMVIDQTGFTGLFDLHLEFRPAAAEVAAGANDSAPSLFTAIQDLGLKLESAKAPMDVVVVDRVQKPSGN